MKTKIGNKKILDNLPKLLWAIVITLAIMYVMYIFQSTSKISIIKSNRADSASVMEDVSLYYYLPRGLLEINSTVTLIRSKDFKPQLIKQTFEYNSIKVPDTNYLYGLKYTRNTWMHDEIELSINPKGLLQTIDIVTEDRLPKIVESVSKSMLDLLTDVKVPVKAEERIDTIELYRTFHFDPYNIDSRICKWNITFNDLKDTINAGFKLCKKGQKEMIVDTNRYASSISGIFSRPITMMSFSIEPVNGRTTLVFEEMDFYEFFPDVNRIIAIPVYRSYYIKRNYNFKLNDGMLEENKITKPSEIEGFISVPINIIKAFFGISNQPAPVQQDTAIIKKLNAIQDSINIINDKIKELENHEHK